MLRCTEESQEIAAQGHEPPRLQRADAAATPLIADTMADEQPLSALPCYVLKSAKVPITGYARMMNVQYFTGIQNKV
jgi:hypothetical protein